MEAIIETIVDKLRYLGKPQLEVVLNFVDFLTWQSAPGVSSKVSDSDAEISDSEFEILLDELADDFIKSLGGNVPVLSDFAISREGIYEEHHRRDGSPELMVISLSNQKSKLRRGS